jgi:hypothetical protein
VSFRAEQDDDGVVIEVEGGAAHAFGRGRRYVAISGKCLVKNNFVFLCWFRRIGIEHTNRWL